MPSLPDVVKNQGVQVVKSTRNYLMIVGLISEDGSMDGTDLRDFAKSNLEKVLGIRCNKSRTGNFHSSIRKNNPNSIPGSC
jgi:HAE1 family hydrophobic/amphiphilic exporter-1